MTKQGTILFGILGLSLALNLFFAGLWFGGKLHQRPSHKMRYAPHAEFNYLNLTIYLQSNLKNDMRRQMKTKKSELHELYTARKAIQRDIHDALSQENLDLDTVKTLLSKHKALTGDLRRPAESLLLEFLPKMTVKQRQKLAKGLLKGKRSDRKKSHKKTHSDQRPQASDY